jgi:hypothetical protein
MHRIVGHVLAGIEAPLSQLIPSRSRLASGQCLYFVAFRHFNNGAFPATSQRMAGPGGAAFRTADIARAVELNATAYAERVDGQLALIGATSAAKGYFLLFHDNLKVKVKNSPASRVHSHVYSCASYTTLHAFALSTKVTSDTT